MTFHAKRLLSHLFACWGRMTSVRSDSHPIPLFQAARGDFPKKYGKARKVVRPEARGGEWSESMLIPIFSTYYRTLIYYIFYINAVSHLIFMSNHSKHSPLQHIKRTLKSVTCHLKCIFTKIALRLL